jgi:hypothetical protein
MDNVLARLHAHAVVSIGEQGVIHCSCGLVMRFQHMHYLLFLILCILLHSDFSCMHGTACTGWVVVNGVYTALISKATSVLDSPGVPLSRVSGSQHLSSASADGNKPPTTYRMSCAILDAQPPMKQAHEPVRSRTLRPPGKPKGETRVGCPIRAARVHQ